MTLHPYTTTKNLQAEFPLQVMRRLTIKLNAQEKEKAIYFGPLPLHGLQNLAELQILRVNLFLLVRPL